MMALVLPKHVGAFIVNLNVNFNILKQFNCALVGQIKDLVTGYNIKADREAFYRRGLNLFSVGLGTRNKFCKPSSVIK